MLPQFHTLSSLNITSDSESDLRDNDLCINISVQFSLDANALHMIQHSLKINKVF
jgi:hypothetical protein